MCGITGIYSFKNKSLSHLGAVEAACKQLALRGPDANGLFRSEETVLGHSRLSIIDTSTDGNQPMIDQSGRYVIVFNGEIYNFRELKQDLIQRGHSFLNSTDTEVLLNAYIAYGTEVFNQLNGFFAFAIYDKEQNELIVARDRFGIKPLYFYQDSSFLAFASELKALYEYPFSREPDFTAINFYFQLNYIPAPLTGLKGVSQLEPGHYIKISNDKVKTERYYSLVEKLQGYGGSYEDSQIKIRDLIDDSVRKRMVSDVPLGAFLSGGLDSSIIVSHASKYTDRLHTFSIGYDDEPFFDETKYARAVAKKFNTEHTVFSLSNRDLYENLSGLLDYMDMPFADSSALPVYALSKRTSQEVTVTLSGDGADELFGGYNKYMGAYRMLHPGLKERMVALANPLWKKLPKSRNSYFGNKIRQLDRFSSGMRRLEAERYWMLCTFFNEEEVKSLLTESRIKAIDEVYYRELKNHFVSKYGIPDDVQKILLSDIDMVLANDMLVKVDRMSMANSLEVRVPFLDHYVVEFTMSLPGTFKVDAQNRKRILHDAYRDKLPKEIYNRPKQGFEVPLLQWFRTDLRKRISSDWLNEDYITKQQVFDPEVIKATIRQMESSNPGDVHARIWALIIFQNWWKKTFD